MFHKIVFEKYFFERNGVEEDVVKGTFTTLYDSNLHHYLTGRFFDFGALNFFTEKIKGSSPKRVVVYGTFFDSEDSKNYHPDIFSAYVRTVFGSFKNAKKLLAFRIEDFIEEVSSIVKTDLVSNAKNQFDPETLDGTLFYLPWRLESLVGMYIRSPPNSLEITSLGRETFQY